MTLQDAIMNRHSVRAYKDEPIEKNTVKRLNEFILECNKESGLNIQLVLNETKAFDCFLAHYGKFKCVKNYIAIVAKDDRSLYEKMGYYGEKIVLFAQTLGLNTCWVALTYKKIKNVLSVKEGEKVHAVISLGYGQTQGNVRKSKKIYDVCEKKEYPEWFINGVKSALLAPTAINQQKFYFYLNGNKVTAKSKAGPYSKMDLGIVKYHFEIGADTENFIWEK